MSAVRMTLEHCGQEGKLGALPPGNYALEYHDATHLPKDQWVRLAAVDVRPSSITLGGGESIEQFYTLRLDIGELPEKPGAKSAAKKRGEGNPDPFADYAGRLRTVADTLSLALARVGLLAPEVRDELLEQVIALNNEDGVVIVPDTNALHNGALHWLLRVLYRPAVWILPLVASITTVQTRDAMVKGLFSRSRPSNLRSALRSRGLVNGALGLLERNKGRCQVVEIDPALLRYQKMASGSGADPDQGDVLEDRLIIEGIHGVLRSMRSRTARRVVTSDVNIARVLAAEGIDTLFVPAIEMGEQPVNCLHYDPLVRGFVGAPLRAVLWELAHAFGSVRLVRDGQPTVILECYWPGKSPADWTLERLTCILGTLEPAASFAGGDVVLPDTDPEVSGANEVDDGSLEETAVPRSGGRDASPSAHPPGGSTASGEADTIKTMSLLSARLSGDDQASARAPTRARVARKARMQTATAPIRTGLPRASFPQVLRLLGALRRLKSGEAEQVVRASTGEAITVETARRAFEILRRVRLLDQNGALMRPTGDAELLDAALRQGDLDAASAIFERFEPYRVFSGALREQGRISRAEVFPLLKTRLGSVGTYESERLPRFHVLLGQAWSAHDAFLDGSNRPTDRDATDAFEEAFASVSSVGLARVMDLLLRFCELTRMSPWAAKRQIERFVANRLLAQYSFQPAAGGKPVVRDEVVSGNLDALVIEPVVIDRLYLGERPVFTVGGPPR